MFYQDMEEAAGDYAGHLQETEMSKLRESESAWTTVQSAAQWDHPLPKKAALRDLGQRTGVQSSTLYNRALVGEVYPRDTWIDGAATVRWTHYLRCAEAFYDGTPESAVLAQDWVRDAEDNQLSTRKLEFAIKKAKGDNPVNPRYTRASQNYVLNAVLADVLANTDGQLLVTSFDPAWAVQLQRLPAGTKVLMTVVIDTPFEDQLAILDTVQEREFKSKCSKQRKD